MDLGIQGRAAVVAAASRGLGRSAAEALAAEGAQLALCARGAGELASAAAAIREQYGVAVFEQALDVTDQAAVGKFVSEARARLGPIGICVTNAGGPPAGTFADFSPQDWRQAFELNFMSALHFIREVVPDMQARKWGRVVTVTSVSVKQPIDGLILSNAVRSAVVGLMKTLVREYGADNVLFNNVCPGYTATGRLLNLAARKAEEAGVSRDEVVAEMVRETPLGRAGRPEEFGAAVAFLCSEKASYINGVSLLVDGGLARGI